MNRNTQFDDDLDLSRFNHLYRAETSSDAVNTTNTIPDGRYEVVVAEAVLTKSQKSGNPMIRWVLRITGSTFRDRIMRKHSAITENTIPFVRKELEICGLRLRAFEDLKQRVQELEGVELEVVRVTKNGDTNVYFNKAVAQQHHELAEDNLPF